MSLNKSITITPKVVENSTGKSFDVNTDYSVNVVDKTGSKSVQYLEYNEQLTADTKSYDNNFRYYIIDDETSIFDSKIRTNITLTIDSETQKLNPDILEYIYPDGGRKTIMWDKNGVSKTIYGNYYEVTGSADGIVQYMNMADKMLSSPEKPTVKKLKEIIDTSEWTVTASTSEEDVLKYKNDVYIYPSMYTKKLLYKAGDPILKDNEDKTQQVKIQLYTYTATDSAGKAMVLSAGQKIYPYFKTKTVKNVVSRYVISYCGTEYDINEDIDEEGNNIYNVTVDSGLYFFDDENTVTIKGNTYNKYKKYYTVETEHPDIDFEYIFTEPEEPILGYAIVEEVTETQRFEDLRNRVEDSSRLSNSRFNYQEDFTFTHNNLAYEVRDGVVYSKSTTTGLWEATVIETKNGMVTSIEDKPVFYNGEPLYHFEMTNLDKKFDFIPESTIHITVQKTTGEGVKNTIIDKIFYPQCTIENDVLVLKNDTEVTVEPEYFSEFKEIDKRTFGNRTKHFKNIVSTVPFSDVEKIHPYGMYEAFLDCRNLKGVSFGKSPVDVDDYGMYRAFSGCWSSKDVDVSKIRTIGINGMYQAFADNRCIKTFDFTSLERVETNGLKEAFKNCIDLVGDNVIEFKKLTYVGENAFERCFENCKLFGKPYDVVERKYFDEVVVDESTKEYTFTYGDEIIVVGEKDDYVVLNGHTYNIFSDKEKKRFIEIVTPSNTVVVKFPSLIANVYKIKKYDSGINSIVEYVTDERGNKIFADNGKHIGRNAFYQMFKGCSQNFEIHFPYPLKEEFESILTKDYLGCKNATIKFDLNPALGEIVSGTYRLKFDIKKVTIFNNISIDLSSDFGITIWYYKDPQNHGTSMDEYYSTNTTLDKPLFVEGIGIDNKVSDEVTYTHFPISLELMLNADGKKFSGSYTLSEFKEESKNYMVIEIPEISLVQEITETIVEPDPEPEVPETQEPDVEQLEEKEETL